MISIVLDIKKIGLLKDSIKKYKDSIHSTYKDSYKEVTINVNTILIVDVHLQLTISFVWTKMASI